MESTKIQCNDLALLLAILVAAIAPAASPCFAQHAADGRSAHSTDMQKLASPLEDEGSNYFDQPFEGTADDKRRMDAFAAWITEYVILFRRFGAASLVRLYVAIGILFMLRSMVKNMDADG